MPDSLYDRDILIWSEQQAEQLRRLAAGERPNVPVDWENVIEELESVGRSELSSCSSLLFQAMLHLVKMAAYPNGSAANHWYIEISAMLDGARRRFSPSMRQKLDLDRDYLKAVRAVVPRNDDVSLVSMHLQGCPFTLDELLAEEPDLDALIARVRAAA